MEQVPSVAPAALLQSPPQHSRSLEHASPSCVQNDTLPLQVPLLHSFEQHSAFVEQALPAVRQEGFSGAHAPAALQFALQH